jgi:hypothetical protein
MAETEGGAQGAGIPLRIRPLSVNVCACMRVELRYTRQKREKERGTNSPFENLGVEDG